MGSNSSEEDVDASENVTIQKDSLHSHSKTFASSIQSLMIWLRSFRIVNSSTKLASKIQFCSPSFPYFILSHAFKLYIFLKSQHIYIHPYNNSFGRNSFERNTSLTNYRVWLAHVNRHLFISITRST